MSSTCQPVPAGRGTRPPARGAGLSARVHDTLWRWYLAPTLLLVLAGLGVGLIVLQYLFNRSLWLDESYLALNLLQRNLWTITQPLADNQSAPMLYLMASRLSVAWFGPSEYALRLVPLLCGITGLLLFVRLARQCLPRAAVPIAVLLAALSGTLAYYSSEVKPYAGDFLCTVVLLLLTKKVERLPRLTSANRRYYLQVLGLFSVVGAVAVWWSFPAILILATAGSYLAWLALRQRDWPRLASLALPAVVWLTSFGAMWLLVVAKLEAKSKAGNMLRGAWLPLPPRHWDQVRAWLDAGERLLVDPQGPLGLYGSAVVCFIFVTGLIVLWRRQRDLLVLCVAPVVLTALASGVHAYPFANRLLLFLVPVLLLVLARGFAGLAGGLCQRSPAGVWVLALCLLLLPMGSVAWHLFTPRAKEEIRPVIAYLAAHRQPQDRIYAYKHSGYPLRYYMPRFGIQESEVTFGQYLRRNDEWAAYCRELDLLRGQPRVWVLYSFYSPGQTLETEYLDTFGKRLQQFGDRGAHVILYDFSQAPPAPASAAPGAAPALAPSPPTSVTPAP